MMTHVHIPTAAPGDRILEAYNALADAVRRMTWCGGEGVSIMETHAGTIIRRLPEERLWLHPWRVSLDGNSLTVSPGVLNSQMAHMAGRRLDGLDEKGNRDGGGVPSLPIDYGMFGTGGQAWVVLRAYADEKFQFTRPAEVVQTDKNTWGGGYSVAVDGKDGTSGDFPLAMLRKDGNGGVRAYQIAYFNMRCRAQKKRYWFFV